MQKKKTQALAIGNNDMGMSDYQAIIYSFSRNYSFVLKIMDYSRWYLFGGFSHFERYLSLGILILNKGHTQIKQIWDSEIPKKKKTQ